MSILIKSVLVDGKEKDISIEGNVIDAISDPGSAKRIREAEFVLEGKNKAAIPGMFNGHTHAAMTLLRGYADDMPLHEWLSTKIWPLEARMTEDEVYWGTKLACLEMIQSGTTFFNDMYWYWEGSARAVAESGLRAMLSAVFIDGFNDEKAREQIRRNEALYEASKQLSERIIFALGPHALYTVSRESLYWVKEFSEKHDLLVHMHISETKEEVEECITRYGMRPVEFLAELELLSPRIIACHCVHLSRKEMELLKNHNVKIVHNPVSNMKLAAGRMPYEELKKAGLYPNIALGTDGCASNNNLDLFEEMKIACLVHKAGSGDPTSMSAQEAFELATSHGAHVFRLNSGVIAEGKLADIVLLDLKKVELVPNHNLVSNIVYAANGSCVDTVICDGAIVMEGRKVEGAEEITEKAQEVAYKLVSSDDSS
ncbi:MAG: amidohydrolase [Methanophagales archaeon ANME-1-THS]|nr:MAG: amidohydrolase [Methanophagales archaeon ANME-1-THS]